MIEEFKQKNTVYFGFYSSIVASFVFLFLSCFFVYFYGVYFNSSSIVVTIHFSLFLSFSILFCVSLVLSLFFSFRYEFKNRIYFYLYLLLMIGFFIGSVFLSKITVAFNEETFKTKANVAPFFLLFVPIFFLIKIFLHFFVFKDIIRSRKESNLPCNLRDLFFPISVLKTYDNRLLSMFSFSLLNVILCSWLSAFLYALFGLEHLNVIVLDVLIKMLLTFAIVSCVISLLNFKKQNKKFCIAPVILMLSLCVCYMIVSLLINTICKKQLEAENSILTIQFDFYPLLIILFGFYISFAINIFNGMKKAKIKECKN